MKRVNIKHIAQSLIVASNEHVESKTIENAEHIEDIEGNASSKEIEMADEKNDSENKSDSNVVDPGELIGDR